MTRRRLRGLVGGVGVLTAGLLTGCGGTVELNSRETTTSGGGSSASRSVDDSQAGSLPDRIPDGWRWNLDCPKSLEEYCADTASLCVPTWDSARNSELWCSLAAAAGLAAVAVMSDCNGYDAVSVYGGSDPSEFRKYYYDRDSGELVHVDSDYIPSYTQCLAGQSGSKHDTFRCVDSFSNCQCVEFGNCYVP